VTPGAFQTENAGAFDVFLVKVDLGKGRKGSGQWTGSVTGQAQGSSGRREGHDQGPGRQAALSDAQVEADQPPSPAR
jgi:hypothetical protein